MKAKIRTTYFIEFLKLFNPSHKIDKLQFGDTRYKREGFIDQGILDGTHTIQAILNLNYDFDGLIGFAGKIGEYQIKLIPRMNGNLEFLIEAEQNNLRNLEYKVIERNAYEMILFEFEYLKEYDK
jgi:hypothetical protein